MKLIAVFITALAITGIVALLSRWGSNRKTGSCNGKNEESITTPCGECRGRHAVCERDSIRAGASKKTEYYNDEELDRFKGTSAGQYPEEAVEEFREILYTMREEDVPGWIRSLQLRQIEIPDTLKEELLLIVGGLRARTSK